MKKLTSFLMAPCLTCLLASCMSHTVVGNGAGDRAASPDGRFRLAVEIHGANGKSYVAETKKRVYVWVLRSGTNNPAPLLRTNYTFRAAGLKWQINWLSTNRVCMELVDYGPGVSSYDRHLTVTNHIARLTFAEREGVFAEEPQ
jgi:hypothetical protein